VLLVQGSVSIHGQGRLLALNRGVFLRSRPPHRHCSSKLLDSWSPDPWGGREIPPSGTKVLGAMAAIYGVYLQFYPRNSQLFSILYSIESDVKSVLFDDPDKTRPHHPWLSKTLTNYTDSKDVLQEVKTLRQSVCTLKFKVARLDAIVIPFPFIGFTPGFSHRVLSEVYWCKRFFMVLIVERCMLCIPNHLS